MFPSCYSKPADSGSKRSSIAKLLLGVFVVYMLHTAWLLYGFLNTKSCDGGRGEHCITSYLAARPRLQVRACLIPDGKSLRSRSIDLKKKSVHVLLSKKPLLLKCTVYMVVREKYDKLSFGI